MTDRVLRCLFVWTSCAGAIAPAQETQAGAAVRLEFREVTASVAIVDGQPAAPERGESTFALTLGLDWGAVETDGHVAVYDFAAGVERRRDEVAATWTETSLLAHVAFVQMEQENRRRLGGVLDAAGLERAVWSPFDLSVEFGWRADGDDESIAHDAAGGVETFSRADAPITVWTASEHELDAARQAVFSRLLQRRARLHPEVREAIVATGRVPATLEFRWARTGATGTATWTLLGATGSDRQPGDVGEARRVFGDERLDRLGAFVLGLGDADVPPRLSRERFVALAEAATGRGAHEDALLLLIEASLATGDSMTAEVRAAVAVDGARAQMRDLGRAMGLVQSDPAAALDALAAIDRTKLSRPAVLDVFRVNALVGLGRRDEARDLLLATLQQVPWLAMAYKDLGDLYLGEYRTALAWRAWDLGRSIAPDHPCWRELRRHEQSLRETFAALL